MSRGELLGRGEYEGALAIDSPHLLEEAVAAELPVDALLFVADMEQRVASTWYDVARGAGVSAPDCELISGAFVYPGFRPEPPPL